MYNRVILMGRLVADPELRQTTSGIPVCAFRIAVNRRFASKDKERQADFFDIVAWRQQAEFVSRFFTKGRSILVEGNLQSRTYEDKQGQKRYAVEVVADALFFTGEPKAGGGGGDYSRPVPSEADAPPAYGGGTAYSSGGGTAYSSGGSAAYSSGSSSDFSQAPLDSEDFPF